MTAEARLFPDIVEEEMKCICSEFAFRKTHRDARSVEFKSKSVYLTIHHSSFEEVDVSFGPRGMRHFFMPAFSMFDVLDSVNPQLAKSWRLRSVQTPEQITESLHEIVSILRTHGKELLSGSGHWFDDASSRRKHRQDQRCDEMAASNVRPKAEAAFRAGDYAKAAELYQSIRRVLTAVELRKLAIAEKKIRGDAQS